MNKRKTFIYLLIALLLNAGLIGKEAFAGKILEKGKVLYSEGNEELIIRDFFDDREGGFFLDVGCGTYQHSSTTYYLEEHLGWSGIAIDALSENAAGYIAKRPKTRFFNYLVTNHSGTIEPFYRLVHQLGRSSADKEQVYVAAEQTHVDPQYEVKYIPTITLNDLLQMNHIEEIDFVSMDIEGGELNALAGFDIEKYRPELVCIEVDPKNEGEALSYFYRHGYEQLSDYNSYDSQNWYFRPQRPLPSTEISASSAGQNQ